MQAESVEPAIINPEHNANKVDYAQPFMENVVPVGSSAWSSRAHTDFDNWGDPAHMVGVRWMVKGSDGGPAQQ